MANPKKNFHLMSRQNVTASIAIESDTATYQILELSGVTYLTSTLATTISLPIAVTDPDTDPPMIPGTSGNTYKFVVDGSGGAITLGNISPAPTAITGTEYLIVDCISATIEGSVSYKLIKQMTL